MLKLQITAAGNRNQTNKKNDTEKDKQQKKKIHKDMPKMIQTFSTV